MVDAVTTVTPAASPTASVTTSPAVTTTTTTPAAGATSEAPKWFYAENVPGVGEKPEYFIDAKYKTVDEQAKAFKAKQSEYDTKMKGFAGAPEQYEVKLVDSLSDVKINVEDPLYKQVSELAKTNGMTNEAFNNLVNTYLTNYKQEQIAEQTKLADYQKAELAKLGPKGAEELPQLEQWGKNNLPDALFDTFKNMVNSADAAKLFMYLRDNGGYSKMPNTKTLPQETVTPSKLAAMMADARYQIDARYQKEVDLAYKNHYAK